MILPYTDNHLIYDYENHMYNITPEYMLDEYGINLNDVLEDSGMISPADLPKMWLKRVSNLVYNRIYLSGNMYGKEYVLAKDGNFRRLIKFWLGEQALYMLNSGDIGMQSGISFERGTSNELYQIRGDRMYSPLMIQSMLNTGILYMGINNVLYEPKYEEEGY